MRVTVLAGGIGGARFLRGVRAAGLGEIVAIVNTGDDITLHGLRVCPDLDSVMYTLGEAHDGARGWGRRGESWRVGEELAAYGIGPGWFGLGDLDLATHLVRTELLGAGYPLSEVTAALGQRWPLGARLLPMTDQRCETHVIVPAAASESEGRNSPRGPGAPAAPSLFDASGDRAASSAPVPPRDPAALADPDARAARRAIHFQEWWVRHRAALPASAFVQVGVADAKPAPGVLEAIATADLVLLAPSNPVVSIGTILGVPGIREAVRATAAPVVGLSPIIDGAPVRGMADACLPVIGVEVSAEGVGRHYGARADGGMLDAWLIHESDTAEVPRVTVRAVPLLMTDDEATATMVRAAVAVAGG